MKIKAVFVRLSVLLLLSFASLNAQSFNLPNGVSIFELDNGIKVLMINKPALPMVGVNVVVKVGSAYENFATSGMSHMLEHLLFNGMEKMTQKELYDAVDKIGAYNNANTSEYYTNFMMVAPAEKIKEAMKIQDAMLFHSTLPLKKFKKEKGIVLEEIAKTLSDPQEQLNRNENAILFKGHALSLPTLGTYETIKHMKRDDVYKFYKNYYVPNNMIMSIIGNFDTAEMLKTVNEIYGKEAPGNVEYPDNSHWATGFEKSAEAPEAKIYHRFYKGKESVLSLFFRLPKFHFSKTYELLEEAAGMQKEDITKAVAKFVPHSSVSLSGKHTPVKSFLKVQISLGKKGDVEKTIDLVKGYLKKAKFSLPRERVEDEAIQSKTSFFKNVEKPHMFGIFNAEKFATEGIEAVLSSYSGENILKAAKELESLKITSEPVKIFQHPFKVEKSKQGNRETLQPVLFMPTEGHPVLIVKTIPGSELLAIHYLIKNKSKLEAEFGKDAAWVWHDAFGQRMDSPEIKKKSAKFGFEFTVNDNPFIPMDNIYLDPNFGYIRVEALADDIPEAIKFLNEQMLNFVPTKKEFAKAMRNLKMVKMFSHSNPAKELFYSELDSLLYEPIPYSSKGKKLDYENLKKFGEKYFSPSNMIVSVVGNISPANSALLFRNFARKNAYGNAGDRAFVQGFNEIKRPVTLDIKGGGEQSYLYFGFQKKIKENEKPALKVLSLLLSDKIIFDIREKQGLAYRMSAGVEVRDKEAMFYINMATMPQNVNKIVPQFPSFFKKDFANSLSKDVLEKTINMYLGRMMFRRLSSINQGYYLGHSFYFNGDVNYDAKFLDEIKNVSLEQVRQVAEKYLKVKNPVTLIVR